MNDEVFKPDLGSKLPELVMGYAGSIAVGALILFASGALYPEHNLVALAAWAGPLLTVVGFVVTAYVAVFRNPVRYEVTGQTLSYFHNGRLAQQVDLANFRAVRDEALTTGNRKPQNLHLVPVGGGDEVRINCTDLPRYEFDAMFASLQERGLQGAAAE